jgi:glycosyltransferase involved in cell wall biosynthesis
MRILLLTQWFQPEPAIKGLPFAKALAKKGHVVEVLTGFPNYPGGKLYPGYKLSMFKTEYRDGIRIIRTFLYPSHSNSRIGRFLNYLTFALSAMFLGPIFIKKPDIIYVYHPPVTIMLPATVLKLIYRIPVVIDIQDMWPDTLKATGMVNSQNLINIIGVFCKLFYNLADHIVVLSPGFKNILRNRGVLEDKISVIYNWCDEESILNGGNRFEYYGQKKDKHFKVVYAGNLGKAQALETIIEAAKIINQISSDIKFLLIGDGTQRKHLIDLAKKLKVDNIEFIPFVPLNKIDAYLSEADVLLVHLKNDPLFSITIPSKTQAYMAIGKPIVMAVNGDASNLIKKANAGICIEPQNPEALAEAIMVLSKYDCDELRELGSSARTFYLKELSLDAGVNKFINLFQELI